MLTSSDIGRIMEKLGYIDYLDDSGSAQEDLLIYVKTIYDDIEFLVTINFSYASPLSLEHYNNAITMDSYSKSRSRDFKDTASARMLYGEEDLKNTIKRMEQRAEFALDIPKLIKNIYFNNWGVS